jgi:hypothetical protein
LNFVLLSHLLLLLHTKSNSSGSNDDLILVRAERSTLSQI